MAGRKLFTKKENKIIKSFLIEHNMFFGGKYGVPAQHWDKVCASAIRYLDYNSEGQAICPLCQRLYIATDIDGFGWCIKCDWESGR